MTRLLKPISRETALSVSGRNVIVTLAPCGNQSEALIGLRLKGRRTHYVMALSDCYRWFAQQYGFKEMNARRKARKDGIPWKQAKRAFLAGNSIS